MVSFLNKPKLHRKKLCFGYVNRIFNLPKDLQETSFTNVGNSKKKVSMRPSISKKCKVSTHIASVFSKHKSRFVVL